MSLSKTYNRVCVGVCFRMYLYVHLSLSGKDGWRKSFSITEWLLYGSDCSVLVLSRLVTRRRNSKSFQWQNSKFEYGSIVKMEHTCMHYAANTFQLLAMNYINLVGIATDRVHMLQIHSNYWQ